MRYFVTGGAGFIGANFVRHILESHPEAEVHVVDLLTYAGSLDNLAPMLGNDPRLTFVRADIRDGEAMRREIAEKDPDYVVNFAAESHVDRSISDPQVFVTTNVLGTQTLLDACVGAWRRADGSWKEGKRYLQISTDEVYGSLTRDYETPRVLPLSAEVKALAEGRPEPLTFGEALFTEESPLRPASPYSATKTAADLLTLAYVNTYGLPALITRCSNNYGPLQHTEKLIPLMVTRAAAGETLPVYAQGLNVRDWLFVEDHCRAVDLVLRKGKPGRIYNIGAFNEQQNIDIVRRIISMVPGATEAQIRHVTDRPGHDMRYAIDPTRIATELGWLPLTPFEKGLKKTIAYYLER